MLGEDWELAADVLGRHWLSLLARGEGAALLEVVDRIPAQVVARARRARSRAGGNPPRRRRGCAGRRVPDPGARPGQGPASGSRPSLRGERHGHRPLPGALAGPPAEGADRRARRCSTIPGTARSPPTCAPSPSPSSASPSSGPATPTAAADHLAAAAGQAAACANDHVLLVAHAYGAAADVRRGNLSAGFTRGRQALELAERRGWTGLPQTAMAHVSLAVVHLWWHELDEAPSSSRTGRSSRSNGSGERLLPTTVALVRARLLLMRGESLQALEGLRGAFEAAPQPHPRLRDGSRARSSRPSSGSCWESPSARGRCSPSSRPDGDAPDLAVGIAALELATGHPEAASRERDRVPGRGRRPRASVHHDRGAARRGRGTRLAERPRRRAAGTRTRPRPRRAARLRRRASSTSVRR